MTGAQLIDVQALKQLIPQLIALAIALGHGSWGVRAFVRLTVPDSSCVPDELVGWWLRLTRTCVPDTGRSGVVLPNSITGRENGAETGVNDSHLHFPATHTQSAEGLFRQTHNGFGLALGAPPHCASRLFRRNNPSIVYTFVSIAHD